MDALRIADKCSLIADSCVHNEQVTVAKTFFNRAVICLSDQDSSDPQNITAIRLIMKAWSKLSYEQENGLLGRNLERIDSRNYKN